MKISREVKPEDLFTIDGVGCGVRVRWLRIDGMDAEVTLTAEDADALSAFFANLAADMRSDAES